MTAHNRMHAYFCTRPQYRAMVRLPHQRDEDEQEDRRTRQDSDAADGDGTDDGEDDDDPEDPIEAIFRIIEEYYEGIAKREDEGMGVG